MDVLTAINQTPWLFFSTLAVLGLCVGSFLNVVIYRLPVMMEREQRDDCGRFLKIEQVPAAPARFDLARPGSHCPHCSYPIKPWENIPLVSYLLLRGRCSHCDASISLRYPAIELTSGLLTAGLGLHFKLAEPQLLGAMLLTWALLALAVIDIDEQLLPDSITLPLLWLGLLFNVFGVYTHLADAVLGAMAGYLCLWSVYWLFKWLSGKEAMGYGDFKLLAALGAWLGWQSIPLVILLASLVGAILGIVLIILQQRSRDIPMPFGPYLAIAGWVAFSWGEEIMAWYWSTAGLQ